MEKDLYEQLTSNINNPNLVGNQDEVNEDDGYELPDDYQQDDDEPTDEQFDDTVPKVTSKNGSVVDQDGKTYEDYLKEMGVEVDNPEGHYVNNAELYQHMVAYCEARDKALTEGKEKPPVDNFIGEAIMKIATHLSFRPNFIGYSYRQDMIGDAIDNCLTYIDSFDPKKSKNPFSYLTQVCWCAFVRRLKLEKRNSIIKGRYMMMSNVTDTMQLDHDDDGNPVINNMGNVHRYMELAQEEDDKQKAAKAEKKKEREARKQANRKKTSLEEFFNE